MVGPQQGVITLQQKQNTTMCFEHKDTFQVKIIGKKPGRKPKAASLRVRVKTKAKKRAVAKR